MMGWLPTSYVPFRGYTKTQGADEAESDEHKVQKQGARHDDEEGDAWVEGSSLRREGVCSRASRSTK